MEEVRFIGITKDTPESHAIQYGKCPTGRDCPTCQSFCRQGAGYLAEKDFARIAKHLGITETKLKMDYLESKVLFNKRMWQPKLLKKDDSHHHGQCIFFNEHEKCTIHGVKPLHCKVSTCSEYGDQMHEWFVLNHIIDADDPVAIREWAQKLKVKPTIHGGELHELVDEGKLKKMLSYDMLH